MHCRIALSDLDYTGHSAELVWKFFSFFGNNLTAVSFLPYLYIKILCASAVPVQSIFSTDFSDMPTG